MSQSMKVTAAATTAITLGVGLWLVQRNPPPQAVETTAATTIETAAVQPSLPPASRAGIGSVAPRTVDAQPRTAPEPLPAAESDEETPLALAKAARTEAMRHCVVEPSVGPVGVFTMRATIVGDPTAGTTFESFEVLDDRGTDTTFVDCMITQLEGFSGPAPTEAFRDVDTQSTFGARPDEIPEDRWIQTIFGGTATAHLSEIRSCEREAGPTKGAVVVSISLEGDPAASEVKIVQSDVPSNVAECIADEIRSWMLPRLVAEPFDYKFELPIDPAVDGTARAPE